MTIMFAVILLWQSADPDLTPIPPPLAIRRLGIKPWMPEEYDASYAVMVQNAKLAQAEKPHAVAIQGTEAQRMKAYPAKLSMRQKKRLYRLELKWIEAEKDRRNRVASLRVLETLKASGK